MVATDLGTTVSYVGPPRWQIPEILHRQRLAHARQLAAAKAARQHGNRNAAAIYLAHARLCRWQIRNTLAAQRALDTIWSERTWMTSREYVERITQQRKATP